MCSCFQNCGTVNCSGLNATSSTTVSFIFVMKKQFVLLQLSNMRVCNRQMCVCVSGGKSVLMKARTKGKRNRNYNSIPPTCTLLDWAWHAAKATSVMKAAHLIDTCSTNIHTPDIRAKTKRPKSLYCSREAVIWSSHKRCELWPLRLATPLQFEWAKRRLLEEACSNKTYMELVQHPGFFKSF